MGDRANLAIIDGHDQHGEPCAIYIHTHWAGSRLPHSLAEYFRQYRGTLEPSALYEFLQERQVRPELATAYFDLEASRPVIWGIDLINRQVFAVTAEDGGDRRLSSGDMERATFWWIPEFIEEHAISPEQVTEWRHLPEDCLTGNLYGAPEENVRALAARPDMDRVRETLKMHEQMEQRQAAREAVAAPTLGQTQDLGRSR